MTARRTALLVALIALLGVLTSIAAAPGTAASTATTVVSADIASATSLTDGCSDPAAITFGSITAGLPATTSTGPGVCRFSFGSSNDTASLRIGQGDGTGGAMQATTINLTTQADAPIAYLSIAVAPGTPGQSVALTADGNVRRTSDGYATTSSSTSGLAAVTHASQGSSTQVWAADYSGGLRVSNDAGATWSAPTASPPIGAGNYLQNVESPSQDVVWASGTNRRIIRSVDGGTTWTTATGLPGSTSAVWPALAVLSATTAIAASDSGSMARTSDGGASWTAVNPPCTCYIWRVETLDLATIYAVTSTEVWRTANSGATWTTVYSAAPDKIYGLHMTATNTVVAVGDRGHVARTTDGVTWTRVASPTTNTLADVKGSGSTYYASAYGGNVYSSTDAGATWIRRLTGTEALADVSRSPGGPAVAVGGGGLVRTSADGGANWTDRSSGVTANLAGVVRTASGICVAVGDTGTIIRSTNGCVTWSAVGSGTTAGLTAISMATDRIMVAVGAAGTVVVSRDGGVSWRPGGAAGSSDLLDVSADDPSRWYAGGRGGALFSSADQGASWTSSASGTTQTITGLDARGGGLVWYVGEHVERFSTNNGLSWAAPSGNSNTSSWNVDVDIIDPRVVLVTSRDTVSLTTDGGVTWNESDEYDNYSASHTSDVNDIVSVGDGAETDRTPSGTSIPDYGGAATWASGAGQATFGVCLQDAGGMATAQNWVEDANNTCTPVVGDPWQALPASLVSIAQTPTGATGNVDLVFGFKAADTTAPGTYRATFTVETVAPSVP